MSRKRTLASRATAYPVHILPAQLCYPHKVTAQHEPIEVFSASLANRAKDHHRSKAFIRHTTTHNVCATTGNGLSQNGNEWLASAYPENSKKMESNECKIEQKKTSNTLKSCRTNCLKVSRKQRLESWQTGLVRFIFLLNLCPSQETDLRRDITGTCQNNTFSVSTLLLLILLCRISFFCVNSTGVDSSVSVLLCRFSFFCVNLTGAASSISILLCRFSFFCVNSTGVDSVHP